MCTALASATHWTHLNRIIVDVCTMTSPGFDRALTKKSAVAFLLNDWWPYITTTIHYTRMGVCVRRPLAIGSLGISGRGHTIKSITPPPINSIRFAITVIARSQILASWSSPSSWTHHQCPFAHPTSTTSSSATCAEMRRIDFPFHGELFIFMRFHMFSNWILQALGTGIDLLM